MDRRKFVKSALLSGSVLGSALGRDQKHSQNYKKDSKDSMNAKNRQQQWYELRTYIFNSGTQQQLTGAYLEQAALPALNRAGIGNIGVFSESQPQGVGKMFLLIPFENIESFASINGKLAHDEAYLKAGDAYLSAQPSSPAYERIESSLLRAFLHMPLIEVPEKKERLFELRCYESPSEAAGQKKIEMFNEAGEIDVFKKIGARPVFFGETIIGERRPNLTYMLCFDNMEAHDARWKAFGSDPEWKKISAMPEYSDARLISKITRTFLIPAPYSQV